MSPWLSAYRKEPVWRLALASIVLLFGLTVLVSWELGIESMVRIHPSWSPTQYNTALTCALLAIAALVRPLVRLASASLALVSLIIAGLTGLQYLTGQDLGIDQLFHIHQIVETGSPPGRMSLNSSLVISALGMAFASQFVSHAAWRDRLSLMSAGIAAGFLSAFLIGYLLGHVELFNLSAATGMGLLTLAMTGALCVINISWTITTSLDRLAQNPISTLVATALFLASFSMAILMGVTAQHRLNTVRAQESELNLLSLTLEARFNEQLLALERIADRWQTPGGTPENAWRADADNYVNHTLVMASMVLVTADGTLRWSEPAANPIWTSRTDLSRHGAVGPAFTQARASGQITISPVFTLPDGTDGFLAVAPIFTPDGAFDGAMIEVNTLPGVHNLLRRIPRSTSLPVHILQPDERPDGTAISSDIQFGGSVLFRLSILQSDIFANGPANAAGALFLAFALVASILALIAVHLVLLNQRKRTLLAGINTQLQIANAELDSFAYTASHDLKSPLRGIRQLVDWLEEDLGDAIPEDAKRYMALLHSRVGRLQGLLDALLEYSRVGRKAVSRSTISLDELSRSAIDLLSLPAGHKVEIIGGEFRVSTDVNLMQIILMNLINNASKHHDRETGRIQIALYQTPETWRVEVSDDGPGIPPDLHERVFGMFETVKSRDEKEASGMGLAIVAKAVTRLDGRIELFSDPATSRGCRFVLEFANG